MKDRDGEHLFQFTFDLEAGGRRDIFQIEAAERGFESRCRRDQFIRIGAAFSIGNPVQADGDGIDVGEVFEQHRFTFHDRKPRFRTDIAQTEDGGTVTHDGDHIAAGGIFPDIFGVFLDRQTGLGDAGGVCQRKIIAGGTGFGGEDGDFAGASGSMIFQSLLFEFFRGHFFLRDFGFYNAAIIYHLAVANARCFKEQARQQISAVHLIANSAFFTGHLDCTVLYYRNVLCKCNFNVILRRYNYGNHPYRTSCQG